MTPFAFRNRAATGKLWAVPTSSPPETPMVPKPKLLTFSRYVLQGAGAAAGADNEARLDDRKVDGAGLRIAIDRLPTSMIAAPTMAAPNVLA
jgi:hypothetical protein